MARLRREGAQRGASSDDAPGGQMHHPETYQLRLNLGYSYKGLRSTTCLYDSRKSLRHSHYIARDDHPKYPYQ